MKDDVLKLLEEVIEKQRYSQIVEEGSYYNLQSLYKYFTMLGVESIEDIDRSREEFISFALKNKDRIASSLKDFSGLPKMMTYNYFKNLSETQFRKDLFLLETRLSFFLDPQKHRESKVYAGVVKELIGDGSVIADVGAGAIPGSAIEIGKFAKKVYAIDEFLVDEKFLQKYGINGIDGYLTSNSKIDDYDFVVGRKPCSAIYSIVKKCANQNKGYFIDLCNCDLKNIKRSDGRVVTRWQDVLPELDSNIKFAGSFAFNIDATPEQVERAVQKAESENAEEIGEYVFYGLKFFEDERQNGKYFI